MTGSRSERGFSYVLSTPSILSMYSLSSFPTHHIFFPPRLEVVAFQQHPDGLPADVRNQFALDHFFGQQTHRPTRPPLRRRRADDRDNALLLLLIKSRSLARTSGIEHRPLQSAIKIPLANLPHRLGGKPQVGAHRRRGLPLIQLAQGQGAQCRAYRLQPASQQLIYLLSISLLEFNLKSYASAHSSAIQSETAPNKYLRRLPIHAVTALGVFRNIVVGWLHENPPALRPNSWDPFARQHIGSASARLLVSSFVRLCFIR